MPLGWGWRLGLIQWQRQEQGRGDQKQDSGAKRMMQVGQWLKSIIELVKSICFYLDGEIGFLIYKQLRRENNKERLMIIKKGRKA